MNITNQTNLGIAINKSMSSSPAINKYNKGIMPNNIEANSIVYQYIDLRLNNSVFKGQTSYSKGGSISYEN